MALLDRLTLHGATLAIAVRVLQEHGAMSWPDLMTRMMPAGHSEEAERELRATLWDLGLIEEAQLDSDTPTIGAASIEKPFRLALLRRFIRLEGPDAALIDIYQWMLGQPEFVRRVLQRDEIWPIYNQASLTGDQHAIMLNVPKMATWLRLASYVGLIIPQRSNSFVLQPALALVEAMLAATVDARGETDLSFSETIAYWESAYCPVQALPGRLHLGYVDALNLLESRGCLRLYHLGDARSVILDRRAASHLQVVLAPGAA